MTRTYRNKGEEADGLNYAPIVSREGGRLKHKFRNHCRAARVEARFRCGDRRKTFSAAGFDSLRDRALGGGMGLLFRQGLRRPFQRGGARRRIYGPARPRAASPGVLGW